MPITQQTDRATVLAELADIFRLVLRDPDIELSFETNGDDLPAWDSMNHIALLVEAECRFEILFQPAEIEQIVSVGDLVRMIQVKRASVHA